METRTIVGALDASPTVAILAGLPPSRAAEVGIALVEAGVLILEVPLRSDGAMESVRILAETVGHKALVGAGTVLKASQVADAKAAGARLIVSPNCDERVISATTESGLLSMPGVFTPTEALRAIELGADALKWFPTDGASPRMLKALIAVLPKGMPVLAVGGVDASNAAEWWRHGARGFGIGSALWQASLTKAQIHERGLAVVAAVEAARAPPPPGLSVPARAEPQAWRALAVYAVAGATLATLWVAVSARRKM